MGNGRIYSIFLVSSSSDASFSSYSYKLLRELAHSWDEIQLIYLQISQYISGNPTTYSVATEEAQNDIHAKLDKLMATHDVIDVDDREIIQGYREELVNMKELLVVSNAEIRRLNAVNDSLQAKELELLERQVIAQETMSALNIDKSQREANSKRKDALIEAKAKAGSILFYVEELDRGFSRKELKLKPMLL